MRGMRMAGHRMAGATDCMTLVVWCAPGGPLPLFTSPSIYLYTYIYTLPHLPSTIYHLYTTITTPIYQYIYIYIYLK